MMKPWKQTKQFTCLRCNARYLHDEAYRHECFECPAPAQKGSTHVAHCSFPRASA